LDVATGARKQPEVTRDARVVRIDPDDTLSTTTVSFHIKNWSADPSQGSWIVSDRYPPLQKSEEKPAPAAVSQGIVELLDPKLENEIIDRVRLERLYQFGRFRRADGMDVLGRVRLTPLMNDATILLAIVIAMEDWVRQKIGLGDSSSLVVVGVDCWGTVLATWLSVRIGCQAFSLNDSRAVGLPQHKVVREFKDESLSLLRGAEFAILICDSVSVGHDFRSGKEEIERLIGQDRA